MHDDFADLRSGSIDSSDQLPPAYQAVLDQQQPAAAAPPKRAENFLGEHAGLVDLDQLVAGSKTNPVPPPATGGW